MRNRSSTSKKTPNGKEENVASTSKDKDQSSGKKLVQARLPFKIIPGGTSKVPAESVTPTAISTEIISETATEVRKRKLSYSDNVSSPIKENLVTSSKKKKPNVAGNKKAEEESIETIVLEDSQDTVPVEEEIVTESPKLNSSVNKKYKKKTTPKKEGILQIKLPLGSSKKKRKSKQKESVQNTTDSSDAEIVAKTSNPNKKAKIREADQNQEILKHVENIVDVKLDIDSSRKELCEDEEKSNKDTSDVKKKEEVNHENKSLTPGTDYISLGYEEKCDGLKGEAKAKERGEQMLEDKTEEIVSSNSKVTKQSDSNRSSSVESKKSKTSSNTSILKPLKSVKVRIPTMQIFATKISPSIKKSDCNKNIKTSAADSDTDINDDENIEVSSSAEKNEQTETSKKNAETTKQNKILTPKQQKLYDQRKKAREEKERKLQLLKEERERKLQEERLQRQKEKEERESAKKREREDKEEQRRKEREDKEEQRRKEREEKERKRLAEIESKNEEKRKKDEAKEEERRKKDDEKRRKELEKEELENRKKKAAEAFSKFFVPTKPSPVVNNEDDPKELKEETENEDSLAFRPFEIKGDMQMAPLCRTNFSKAARNKLDEIIKLKCSDRNNLQKFSGNHLYLDELKSGSCVPIRWRRPSIELNDEDDDVIFVEDSLERAGQAIDETRVPVQRFRAKFYSFFENKRPPFYGTWRKKTSVITSRRPFALDKVFFDYEVDSDDEWEEEEPGESLNGSEDEKENESEDDDYEVDNEWFVPHGHLSDEELQNQDEIDQQDCSREAQKAKLIVLQQEFVQEMKKKTEKIKPRLLGCMWQDENGNKPEICPNIIWNILNIRAMVFTEPPLVEEPQIAEVEITPPPPVEKQKRLEVTDDMVKDLIHLVHGNRHSKSFLVNEFLAYVVKMNECVKTGEFLAPHKSTIRDKIDEISAWQIIEGNIKKKKMKKKLCWIVTDDILEKNSLKELGHHNTWSYTLAPKFPSSADDIEDQSGDKPADSVLLSSPFTTSSVTNPITNSDKKKSAITKFAKVLTPEEKALQFSPKSIKSIATTKSLNVVGSDSAPTVSTATTPVIKKRVAFLASGPRGQPISAPKNALISRFLKKDGEASTSSAKTESTPNTTSTYEDNTNVIILD